MLGQLAGVLLFVTFASAGHLYGAPAYGAPIAHAGYASHGVAHGVGHAYGHGHGHGHVAYSVGPTYEHAPKVIEQHNHVFKVHNYDHHQQTFSESHEPITKIHETHEKRKVILKDNLHKHNLHQHVVHQKNLHQHTIYENHLNKHNIHNVKVLQPIIHNHHKQQHKVVPHHEQVVRVVPHHAKEVKVHHHEEQAHPIVLDHGWQQPQGWQGYGAAHGHY